LIHFYKRTFFECLIKWAVAWTTFVV